MQQGVSFCLMTNLWGAWAGHGLAQLRCRPGSGEQLQHGSHMRAACPCAAPPLVRLLRLLSTLLAPGPAHAAGTNYPSWFPYQPGDEHMRFRFLLELEDLEPGPAAAAA